MERVVTYRTISSYKHLCLAMAHFKLWLRERCIEATITKVIVKSPKRFPNNSRIQLVERSDFGGNVEYYIERI